MRARAVHQVIPPPGEELTAESSKSESEPSCSNGGAMMPYVAKTSKGFVIQRNECGFGKRNSPRLEEEKVRKDERPVQGVAL